MRVWFDLDNTPHVPFFLPIIEEVKGKGMSVLVTIRDAFQVRELMENAGIPHCVYGKHNGRNKIRKCVDLVLRAGMLCHFSLGKRIDLAISHGSRAQLLAARIRGIRSLELTDYEHAQSGGILSPTWLMAPEPLRDCELAKHPRFLSYPGLKEDVYMHSDRCNFRRRDLGIDSSSILVVVRPPATEAHYHDARSEDLLDRLMTAAVSNPLVRVVLLPRNQAQQLKLSQLYPHWFQSGQAQVPGGAVDGAALVREADLVVSGGGTMVREAAAVGVPAVSVFTGALGSVDRDLERQGTLRLLRSIEEVDGFQIEKRHLSISVSVERQKRTVSGILDGIEVALESKV